MARSILRRLASVSLLDFSDLGRFHGVLTAITVGGLASGGGTSGGSDSSGSQKGEFAHGKVDPSEAGKRKSSLWL
jgi:hypothetical protein